MFVDTHSHLYLSNFDNDIANVVNNAINNNIKKIYLPNIDSTTIDDMLSLEKNYPDIFHSMIGLHPGSVNENYKKELDIVKRELEKGNYVGIGEVGIDLYWDKTYKKEQIDAFNQQVIWAKEYNLPVIIHARDAMDLTIEIIENNKSENLNGIFHCFTGNIDQAFRIMKTGFKMGIGGIVTYKNSGLDKVVREIPLEYIVLETDSPYLPPVPFRGKRNESSYLVYIANKIAEIKGLPVEEIEKITTINANKIFN